MIGAHEANLMQSKNRSILGARSYLQKIRYKHGITPSEAYGIQDLIDSATIVLLPKQPTSFQFHGKIGGENRRYKLILKVVNGEQIWLSTLFRSDIATFRAAIRKGIVLKE